MNVEMTDTPGFLDLPVELAQENTAHFHVVPAPYEENVSYGGGTWRAPKAILRASAHVEWFDGTGSPAQAGIFTQHTVARPRVPPAQAVSAVAGRVRRVLQRGSVPVVLGGEHTVSLGGVTACLEQHPGLGVVQFDAHADLRNEYNGTSYSHACTARRILDMGVPLFQVGTRSMSEEEHLFRRGNNIPSLDADAVCRGNLPCPILPTTFPRDVYVTVDVDVLDPSIIPATGTPEPGGLNWYQTVDLFREIVSGRNVVGFDVVELAPMSDFHAADFTVAKLTYTMMGIVWRNANGNSPSRSDQ